MALTLGQIPLVANVPNGGVARLQASANTVTIDADTNGLDVYVAGAQGGRVFSLSGVTDDTVAVSVFVWRLDGSTHIPLGFVNIPISSGNTNAARYNVDFLNGSNILGLPMDSTGKYYIPLKPNEKLRVGASGNLTAAKSAWIQSAGADYQV
jgi:hypothetical protein